MLTNELIEDIKREEGFVAKVYLDKKGKKTIGYGTLLEDGISEAEAEMLLRHRLGLMAEELEGSRVGEVYANLKADARRALLDMAYNMGVPSLLGFRKMWAALADENYALAAAEALDSDYARELPARASRVAERMRSA